MDNKKIKQFVQETLKCGCPEEVFSKIETGNVAYENLEAKKILVGDRLLIYVVDEGNEYEMEKIFIQGVSERNDKDYNRFRFVILGEKRPDFMKYEGDYYMFMDEKTHVHCLLENEFIFK